ncbi:hypothetical protein [Scytonema sp. PCC 10023]|uniref:hypothetical protein n=1 Tax=Scytonema sp. PCC 10023 TaxID=1680591 RepID=UPI0039C622D4
MTTRVILNILAGTLRGAFDSILFSTVDGQGMLFSRTKSTAVAVCEDLRTAGALYGATPEDAYLVVCDATNNQPGDLDNGQVSLDVIVKPSPVNEVMVVRLSRASLGTVLASVLSNSANVAAPIVQPGVNTTASTVK